MHYDSEDEGRGVVRHPVVSTVLYLSGGELGGDTLVTNQRAMGPLADKGWRVTPKQNRVAMFQGNVLHGVIPGDGCPGQRCGLEEGLTLTRTLNSNLTLIGGGLAQGDFHVRLLGKYHRK